MKLKPVTPANLALAESLTVRPDQRRFLASFETTQRDAKNSEAAHLRLAYVDGQPIGYLLLTLSDVDAYRVANITRLMIDRRWQGRGLGRTLLETALIWIESFRPAVHLVRISAVPKNRPALSLYETSGFTRMGVEDGEIALYRTTRHLKRP